MTKDFWKSHGGAIASACATGLMAWGAMKAEVSTLKDEVSGLRDSAAKQDERIVQVKVEAGIVGGKLDGILRELQALREDIRERAHNTASVH